MFMIALTSKWNFQFFFEITVSGKIYTRNRRLYMNQELFACAEVFSPFHENSIYIDHFKNIVKRHLYIRWLKKKRFIQHLAQ